MGSWRRAELKAGVYDEIVSARLDRQLAALGADFDVHRAALTASEPIGAVLESLLGDGLVLALADLKADSAKGIALAEAILAVLRTHAPRVFEREDELRLHSERLSAIVAKPAQAPQRPRGSLHASSLIVNAEGDRLLEHLRSEFDSADSIDLLCAFVKLSGFEKFRSELELPTDEPDWRLARMLFVVLYGKEIAAGPSAEVLWAEHQLLREEIAGLVPVLRELNAVLTVPHALAPAIPLVLHARYLGVELSAAFDHRTAEGKFRDYYTGVELTHDRKFDLLLVTLEKAATTKKHLRYRDFPLNEKRFHWQSKERTTRESNEGRRHLEPAEHGVTPLLFVRERADDRSGVTMAFRYLGPVQPDGALSERPITIEWRLTYAMPHEVLAAGRVAS